MGKLKGDSNVQIYGWMATKLGLKGNELLIYAIIYSFSKNDNGNGVFNASISYLREWTNSSKPNVIDCLTSLLNKNLIIKLEDNSHKREPNVYKTNDVPNLIASKQSLPAQVKKVYQTSKQSLPNNNIINTIDNNIIDDDFKEVADSFSNNIHPISGKLEADILIDLTDEYGKQWVIEGIMEMVKYHGTNVAYLNKILLNWKKYGKNNKPKKEQQQMNSAEYGF